MQFSLLSLLSLMPAQPMGKAELGEGVGTEGGNASDLFSFDQWLSDNGISFDQLPKELGEMQLDWFGDSVSNLVVAQGDAGLDQLAANPAAMLAMLNANTPAGLKQLAQMVLTPSQSAQMAEKIGQFLQRPDTAAELNEQQRVALAGMLAHFKQAAKSEVAQPIAPAVENLDKALPAHAGNAKERMPVLGQVMKWLQHVLRDARQQAAGTQVSATDVTEAPLEEAVPVGFPALAIAVEETSEEAPAEAQALSDEDAVALIATLLAPEKPVEKVEPLHLTATEEVLPEIALPSLPEAPEAAEDIADTLAAEHAKRDALVAADAEAAVEAPDVMPAMTRQEQAQDKRELTGLKPVKPFEVAVDVSGAARPEQTLTAQAVTAPVQTQVLQATGAGSHGVSHGHATSAHVPESQYGTLSQQVQVGIKQVAQGGIDRITIQLTPEDMGRVDVRLDVGADGRAHIVFTADKADALEQMQRDARFLEKALQDSGVKADAGSMEFNLRQQNQHAAAMQDGGGQRERNAEPQWDESEQGAGVRGVTGDGVSGAEADSEMQHYQVSVATGLDIRV